MKGVDLNASYILLRAHILNDGNLKNN